jgi:hypothetical protein
MIDMEDTGTIDWLVIEFPGGKEFNGALVPPILDLVDRRIIRILDALLFRKSADGVVETQSTNELDTEEHGLLGELAGATSGLIDEADAVAVGDVLANDSSALMVVFENLWSLPLARKVRHEGGQLAASGRIPVQAILARLDALEAQGS